MIKCLIKLDEEKINSDGIYTFESIRRTVDRIFGKFNIFKDSDDFYIKSDEDSDFTGFLQSTMSLKGQSWFTDYVEKWIWYECFFGDEYFEDLKAAYCDNEDNDVTDIGFRRGFNIKLNKKSVREYCPKLSYKEATQIVENFALENDFKIGACGYESVSPMGIVGLVSIIEKISYEIPWLKLCLENFDVYTLGETVDYTWIFRD